MGMRIQQAYRYELDPNNVQKTLLSKHAGCARFAYNWGLSRRIEEYKRAGKSSNAIEQHRQLNALKPVEFPWMYEVSKCAPQEALRNLDRAYQHFFRRVKNGEKAGFPKFKRKGIHDSFRLTGSIQVNSRRIQLPRVGSIRTKENTAKFSGKLLSASVRRIADRWYVSLCVEREISEPSAVQGEIVGADVGLGTFVKLSDGSSFDSARALKKNLLKLQRLSRSHSRKPKGSNNRRKSAVNLARLHFRIQSLRNDAIHKLTTCLAKTKRAICVESLQIQGMAKNHNLARSIQDASWGEFIRQLEYKCRWYGATLIFAPAHFPSSKKCSRCGNVKKSLPLRERTYICEQCGSVIDRDLNAAINLENYAKAILGLLGPTTASSAGSHVCGETALSGRSWKQKENGN